MPHIVAARLKREARHVAAITEARRQMEFLLAVAQPDVDLDQSADRYLEQMIWRAELRWHPAMITRQPVTGMADLLDAKATHRGLIVNFMHHGQYDGAFASLRHAGAGPVRAVAHAGMFLREAPADVRQHLRVVEMAGPSINVAVGFSVAWFVPLNPATRLRWPVTCRGRLQ